MKHFFLGFAVALLTLFIFIVVASQHADRAGAPIAVTIPPGAGMRDIAALLHRKGVVSSPFLFEAYAAATGRAGALKPGKYAFDSMPSLARVVAALVQGPPPISFTLAPGMTVDEVDERLAELGVLSRGELARFNPEMLRSRYAWLRDPDIHAILAVSSQSRLEGFLFPETYRFSSGQDVTTVAAAFLDAFTAQALPLAKKDGTLGKIVILASILEKEIPDGREERIAAGILEKREAADMPLQVDATIRYDACKRRFTGCAPLTTADYERDSPYNTYRRRGLPPSPISNPSLTSIHAALDPIASSYWYYLSDPITKKTIFANTLDEQIIHRATYLMK